MVAFLNSNLSKLSEAFRLQGIAGGVFLIMLMGFLYFKWSFLALPFYWDEAWVYGPAIIEMIKNGPSLLPDAINTDLSRGHPLLFHFLGGLWGKLFGTEREVLHGFALFVSSCLLFLTFRVGKQHFNGAVGLAACALLLFNEKFLTQSGLLLPEVMLALFALWAFHAYLIKSPVLFVITATCALFTKESGLVLIVAVLVWHTYELLKSKEITAKSLLWFVYALIPVAIAASYFAYQKHLYGWYLYPLHSEMVSFDLNEVKGKFKIAFSDLFELQRLAWLTVLIAVILPLTSFRKLLGWKLGFAIALIAIAAVKILFGRWTIPDPWKLLVAVPMLASLLFLYFDPLGPRNSALRKFLGASWVFILGFMLFSSLNFFANRYLLILIPLVSIGSMALLCDGLSVFGKRLFPAVSALFICVYAMQIGNHSRSGDCELVYANNIQIHQQLIDYFIERDLEYTTIYTSFVAMHNMTNPSIGYLPEGTWFGELRNEKSNDFEYAIFTSDMPEYAMEAKVKANPLFELIETYNIGESEGRIYKLIKN